VIAVVLVSVGLLLNIVGAVVMLPWSDLLSTAASIFVLGSSLLVVGGFWILWRP
jgi:hypothetical protein